VPVATAAQPSVRRCEKLDRSFFAVLYSCGLRTLRDPTPQGTCAGDLHQGLAALRDLPRRLGAPAVIKAILRHLAIERLRQPTREIAMEDHQGLTEDAARRIREISISLNLTPDHTARRREYEACFRTGWTRFLKEDPLHANVIAWISRTA